MSAPPSRLSSPLSEFTPSPPPTAAPPSPSISSDSSDDEQGAGGGGGESEVDELAMEDEDELGEGGPSTGGAKKRAFSEVDEQSQPAPCQWGDCSEEFWELEPLIEHLHQVHALAPVDGGAPRKGGLQYICDWTGCPRRGKNQNSRFALISHLRSHTGEKPFTCPRPECDKSFTRTDALQKHMRIQHCEHIAPGRRPQQKKGGGRKRAGSVDSAADDPEAAGGTGTEAGAEDADAEPVWTEDDLRLFEQHPEQSRYLVGYVVERAKFQYGMKEHEGLLHELEALGAREAELGAECEELLRRVLRKEVGHDPKDPTNADALETFLTAYDHVPTELPAGFTH